MRKIAVLAVMAALWTSASLTPLRAESTWNFKVGAEARGDLEQTLELWRDGRLEEVADRVAHGGKSREEVVRALGRARQKPACCWEKLQDVRIEVQSAEKVELHGKFGMDGGVAGTGFQTRKVRLVREDGVWKVPIQEIMALAGGKKGKKGK